MSLACQKCSLLNRDFFCPSSGRETEWLFSSVEGQKELATNAGFERVVIATLGRGHTFTDMETIKKELSTKVMELGPKKLSHNAQVMNQERQFGYCLV